MRRLGPWLFYGLTVALVVLGGAGIFTGGWELERVYGVDLDALGPEAPGLLNQYRYLKAIELGFGAFCVVFRKQILQSTPFNRLFVWVVFAGVAARVFSMVVDGPPRWGFVGIAAFELAAGVAVWLCVRGSREGS